MTKDTPTPRTDAFVARFDADPDAAYVEVLDFARELERDLTACRAALELLRQYAGDSDDHQYGTLSTSLVRGIVDEALGLPDAARAILQTGEGEGKL